MVDQVTFPPSIGGSGKTYTNDANPQTGMFNGGHRVNFFPILSDTLAAAGYVSQYAQAIDGAAANADKAEDAKGYVEAVAGAYKVNLMDAYRDRITLGADFKAGRYTLDDSVRLDTNSFSDIFNVSRASAVYVEAAMEVERLSPSDSLPRKWLEGKPDGALMESASTNAVLASADFSSTVWNKTPDTGVSVSGEKSPLDGIFFQKVEANSTGLVSLRVQQTLSINSLLAFSFYFQPTDSVPFVMARVNASADVRVAVDPVSKEINALNFNGDVYVKKLRFGYRIEIVISDLSPGVASISLWGKKTLNYSTGGDSFTSGDHCLVTAVQLENNKRRASSYIDTTDSAVTRASWGATRTLSDEWNPYSFTLIVKGRQVTHEPFGDIVSLGGVGEGQLQIQVYSDRTRLRLSNATITQYTNDLPNDYSYVASFNHETKTFFVCTNGELVFFDNSVDIDISDIDGNVDVSANRIDRVDSYFALLPYSISQQEAIEVSRL